MRLKIKEKGQRKCDGNEGAWEYEQGKLEEGMIGKCDRSKGLWNGP